MDENLFFETAEAMRAAAKDLREIVRLRAKLAADEKDAERWRYLRDDGDGFEITVRETDEDGGETWIAGYPPNELDAAIDAARKL
jgi:hypothetical protein